MNRKFYSPIENLQPYDTQQFTQKLAYIIGHSPVVAFTIRLGDRWTVEYISENISQYGYSSADLLDGQIFFYDIIHPDDRDRVSDEVVNFIAQGKQKFTQEYRIIGKSGQAFWLEQQTWVNRNSTGMDTQIQGILVDVSDRKRSEDALRLAKQKLDLHLAIRVAEFQAEGNAFQTVLEGSHNPLVYLDTKYSILRVNTGFSNTTGIQPGLLIGENFFKIFPDAEKQAIFEQVKNSGKSQNIRVQTFSFKNQNTEKPFYWSWTLDPVTNSAGDVEGLVLSLDTEAIDTWRDLTELDKVTSQLEAEKARLDAIIENSPEAIVVTDNECRVVVSNPAASRLFSQTLNPGLLFGDITGLQIGNAEGKLYELDQIPLNRSAIHGEIFENVEISLRRTKGKSRYLLASTAPITDYKGNPRGAIGIFQDISERKRAEVEMHKMATQAELLATLSQAFTEAGLELDAVSNTIARKITESMGDACSIRLLSEDGHWLNLVAFYHPYPGVYTSFDELRLYSRQKVNEGLAGRVFQTNRPLLISHIPETEAKKLATIEYWPWIDKYPVRSVLFVPLRVRGQMIGTIGVLRSKLNDPYGPEDRDFFLDLANRAAMAIENARLYASEARRAQELRALQSATAALLTTLDIETLLGHILDSVTAAIPTAEKGALHLIAPDTGELQLRATNGYADPRIKKYPYSKSVGYSSIAVREKRAFIISDVQKDPAHLVEYANAELHNVRSAIVVPLILGGKVLGALSLYSTKISVFNQNDLDLLVGFATTITAAIQNATLHTEVQKQAITDPQTGLYNRRGFYQFGQREIERTRRFGHPLSILMMDIDFFKEVNDTHTHAIGDQVLYGLSKRLASNLREVDVLGRYGGEEFCVLLPETDLFTACNVAERLRRCIQASPFQTDHGPITISISIGVAKLGGESTELESIVERADVALYAAKQAGRNRVEVR